MDVDILGNRHLHDDFHVRASAKLARLGRMAPLLDHAELRFIEDDERPADIRWVCEATATGHGHSVHCRVDSRDPLSAVELAVAKLEHQVERLKGKLVDRSQPRRPFSKYRAVVGEEPEEE